MSKSIGESKAAALHALYIGIYSIGFYELLNAKKLILAALDDLQGISISDKEAGNLSIQLESLLGQIQIAIDEARGIVCDEPDSDPDTSHRPGARFSFSASTQPR